MRRLWHDACWWLRPLTRSYMAEVAERMGMMDEIKLRTGLFGAEGSTEEMRRELERRWHITATENYGMQRTGRPRRFGGVHRKMRHAHQ